MPGTGSDLLGGLGASSFQVHHQQPQSCSSTGCPRQSIWGCLEPRPLGAAAGALQSGGVFTSQAALSTTAHHQDKEQASTGVYITSASCRASLMGEREAAQDGPCPRGV